MVVTREDIEVGLKVDTRWSMKRLAGDGGWKKQVRTDIENRAQELRRLRQVKVFVCVTVCVNY